ncbi:hypothetical protein M436DRAFT_81721 [Aureobasidium namibiae CBS 147.97]|uniref:Purine and uridine phosphorylase n=1 Tax=Aureobasidium namibiae CBS 147.97 TaxID=1043004 RepID=A0A074XFE5_9PEZI|nr:uncharacterized protein M436DRAFT_81721 [Aureobasidium namibiae CBS 147.97]KEQ73336.1 hypothetical protein M436DRAFT_81721 [Aureobasidium namibiae CBS 147.97]
MNRLKIDVHLLRLTEQFPAYELPSKLSDDLYAPDFLRLGEEDCLDCGSAHSLQREARHGELPVVQYGTIASGNMVMRDGIGRDKINQKLGGLLCFEMEAAALMNNFPCLVIRGSSDYADSHKIDGCKLYAAATAAAFSKELLVRLAPTSVSQIQTINQAMDGGTNEREILEWLSPPVSQSNIQDETRDSRLEDTGGAGASTGGLVRLKYHPTIGQSDISWIGSVRIHDASQSGRSSSH